MNNNLVIISGITVSLLIVILLFKLNKTKIEYDNKLLVINRKVRDLTNLVDLSNTKKNLIENSENLSQTQQNVKNIKNVENVQMTTTDKQANIESNNKSNLENEYNNFVSTNENFFNNVENYDIPLDDNVKENIDSLVNNELNLKEDVEEDDKMYENLDSFSFEQKVDVLAEQEILNIEDQQHLSLVENKMNIEEYNEMPKSSLDKLKFVDNNNQGMGIDLNENVIDILAEVETNIVNDKDNKIILENMDINNLDVELEIEGITDNISNVVEEQDEEDEEDEEVEETNLNNNTSINFEDLDNMSVKDLQEICRQNKLKVKGRKDEIILRIKEFFSVSKL